MLQVLGSFMVMFGVMGMGYGYIEKEKKRIHRLEVWEGILQMFISEITYKKEPLALACYEIGKKAGEKEGKVLKIISQRMLEITRKSFPVIWQEECEKYCKEEKVDCDTRELIQSFGILTGFEDEALQKKMIEEQKEKWKKLRVKLQDEHQERKRIVLLLSSCLGLVIVLILW